MKTLITIWHGLVTIIFTMILLMSASVVWSEPSISNVITFIVSITIFTLSASSTISLLFKRPWQYRLSFISLITYTIYSIAVITSIFILNNKLDLQVAIIALISFGLTIGQYRLIKSV